MTLLKDNNYKDINVALLSLEADIKKLSNNGGFDTSVIDRQLAEINSRIDKINASGNNSSAEINDIRTEIENINTKLRGNSVKIENIEQKLSDIFSAENEVTDFNTTTDSGIYYWLSSSANKPGADSGVLLVNKYDSGDSASNLWINQIAYGTNSKIYFRQNIDGGSWTEWKAVAFDGEKVSMAETANYLFYTQGNEINFKGGAPGQCWFNYRNADTGGPSPVDTMEYIFCNYSGDTSKSVIKAGTVKSPSKMVIPIGAPSSLEDGCIWIG